MFQQLLGLEGESLGLPFSLWIQPWKSALSSLLATWAKRPVRCLLLQLWGTLQSQSLNPEAKRMLQRVARLRWPTRAPRASSHHPAQAYSPLPMPRTSLELSSSPTGSSTWKTLLAAPLSPFFMSRLKHRLHNHPTQKGLPLVTLRGTVLISYLFLSE